MPGPRTTPGRSPIKEPHRQRAGTEGRLPPQAALPGLDRLLASAPLAPLIARFGRALVTEHARAVLEEHRARFQREGDAADVTIGEPGLADSITASIEMRLAPSLKPVFNLTGTVIHTNLGRAVLPEEAIEAMAEIARTPSNLELDLADGRRGDRDAHLERRIAELTGAEAATVVNNNAAAVLLVLNTLALRKEVPVSRGELIEIGGAFRMPEIMARAGAKLLEVGTTNRTRLADFEAAISPRTGLLMKVHPSNYVIEGFSESVPERALAGLAAERGLPLAVDLGSGTLVDLTQWALPREPTVRSVLEQGADLVTFSGDKLLGGPQAGIITGRAALIARLKANPLRRALRIDKLTTAALEAVLRLYLEPERLRERLPALRSLTRGRAEIEAAAERLRPALAGALEEIAAVSVVTTHSQIGSGALPVECLPSAALAVTPPGNKRLRNRRLERLAGAMRRLPVPVIGRIEGGRLLFDLRCLEDEAAFLRQLDLVRALARAAP